MPTLLEKPTPAALPVPSPVQVLNSRHRWERWRWVLLVLLIGLAATLIALAVAHPSVHTPKNWKLLAGIWAGGSLLTGIAAAIAWRFAPASLTDTAQAMDRSLAAKNRLEAAAALQAADSPLARAQREETLTYLQHEPRVKPVRAFPWLVGGLLGLLVTHLLTFVTWVGPVLFQPPVPVPPPLPKELPRASIIWKAPEPESKANPVEEVPLVAVTQSTTGLKNLSLEISVNGEPKKSLALPAKPYDTAGKNTLKTSIYMDELGVEPFDVVTYFIKGERITDQKVPDTTSPIQFIQVRPFRDDVGQVPGGKGNPKLQLLIRLKLAQLRSVKENFILAHTDLPVTDPTRMKENTRVGKNEAELAVKTEEVVQSFIEEGYPAEIIDLLRQAEAPMDEAAKKILANENGAALPLQQKALSNIIEVEKFFHKVMAEPSQPSPASNDPNDPFKDKQQHEMKKRFEAAAGQLEQLAKNQAKLSKELNQNDAPRNEEEAPQENPAPEDKPKDDAAHAPKGQKNPAPAPGTQPGDGKDKPVPLPTPQAVDPFKPDNGKGTFAERQARVLQGIETLLNTNTVLPPEVNTALEDAKNHAADSLRQLDQGSETNAREPAAAAARSLQQAIDAMNKAGEKEAKQAMEDAQQKLNDLAKQLNDMAQKGAPGAPQSGLSDLANKTREERKELENQADKQQEGGSADSAQKLNNLANQMGKQNIAPELDKMAKTGLDPKQAQALAQKLEELAAQAAHGTTNDKPTPQDIANLINSLERSRANLARLAAKDQGAESPTQGQTPGKDGQQPGGEKNQPSGTGKEPGKEQGQGQQPGEQKGPGETPGPEQGAGQKPGDQPGQGEGKQPEKQPGQGQGQEPGQGQGEKPGEQAGKGQGQQPEKQPGQGEGKGQGQQPNDKASQGQGPGEKADTQQGQGAGQGQGEGHSENLAQDANAPKDSGQNGQPKGDPQDNPSVVVQHPDAPSDRMGNGGGGGDGINGAEGRAYREVLNDLKNQVQQATIIVPDSKGADGRSLSVALEDNHYRDTRVGNVAATYRLLGPPLGKMIADLKVLLAQAQRDDLVKQSELDEAPAPYRPAVSDYFENMSKDYHPDSSEQQDPKKP